MLPSPGLTCRGANFAIDQGQGGGQAIEDAASLAVMLGRGTPREEIPEKLKLYQKCRQERANRIQQYTRLAGRDTAEIAKSGQVLDSEYFESSSKPNADYFQ
jgi:2-polyprenyl-6-methoxyphenol hydroxylase-like FAD-dependent oxidoreductase